MKNRYQLFEWEDLSWFPNNIRMYMMDVLTFMINHLNIYQSIVPQLVTLLRHTNEHEILDLCSGCGGGIIPLVDDIQKSLGRPIKVTLSDKYPQIERYQYLKEQRPDLIDFVPSPIDLLSMEQQEFLPEFCSSTRGIRTIFSAFHHFQPKEAEHILQELSASRKGIGIFEGSCRSINSLIAAIFLLVPMTIYATLLIRPFDWQRFLFTFIIPIIPICIWWDGISSILKMYEVNELQSIIKSLPPNNYYWNIGTIKHSFGFNVTYVIGYPNYTL